MFKPCLYNTSLGAELCFDNKVESHSLVMGASGKVNRSCPNKCGKMQRLRGDLLVDTEMYREGRGWLHTSMSTLVA